MLNLVKRKEVAIREFGTLPKLCISNIQGKLKTKVMQFFFGGGGGWGDSRSKGVRARCKGDVQMVNVIAPKESNKFYSKIPNNQITNSSTFLTWFI